MKIKKSLIVLLSLLLTQTAISAAGLNSVTKPDDPVLPEQGPKTLAELDISTTSLADLLDSVTAGGTLQMTYLGTVSSYSGLSGRGDQYIFVQTHGSKEVMTIVQGMLPLDPYLFVAKPPTGQPLRLTANGNDLVTWELVSNDSRSSLIDQHISQLRTFCEQELSKPMVCVEKIEGSMGEMYLFRPADDPDGYKYGVQASYFARPPQQDSDLPILLHAAKGTDHPAVYWEPVSKLLTGEVTFHTPPNK